ncbi:MAG: type II toxin-antitoxin system RelE/ParE family toxin [Armatimonadetes bacterium]|nr:type II toxin-antitoxin system RelE/ParE family toxin [Armatimonadota bacterium]
MAWKVEWDERAVRDAEKLGHEARRRILKYLRERIATDADPRRLGKPLTADRAGFWRYRVGDYRIVCRIEDDRVVVLVLAVGHRSTVYD